ncbi:MAG: efflux RND transporter permease subunit, partial [Persicimonas sp.]
MSKPTQQHPSQDGTTDADKQPVDTSGPLAWMTQNTVAANLLMVLFIVGGIVMLGNITKEVFPEVQLDVVSVQVPYPGASPEEVEQGVLLAAEEAIRGVDGIDEIRSTASEGAGVVTAELITDTDAQKALNDIKSEIDRVTSFPRDAERPIISLSTNRRSVLSVIVYGDVAEASLNALAERVRSDLLAEDNISAVEVTGIPDPEISIEVPQQNLRRYN